MNTLHYQWANNLAIQVPQWVELAQTVGLKKIYKRSSYYTSLDLEDLLVKYGPLWAAGNWYHHRVGHVIVLTGVDGERITINDPDPGVSKNETVSWFNSRLFKYIDVCLLHKDPSRY